MKTVFSIMLNLVQMNLPATSKRKEVSLDSITLIRDIEFKSQSNSSTLVWAYVRDGKIDRVSQESDLQFNVPSSRLDAAYDSHHRPYCILMIHAENSLLDSDMTLKKGTKLQFAEGQDLANSNWLHMESGVSILCRANSGDKGQTKLTLAQVEDVFGSLAKIN